MRSSATPTRCCGATGTLLQTASLRRGTRFHPCPWLRSRTCPSSRVLPRSSFAPAAQPWGLRGVASITWRAWTSTARRPAPTTGGTCSRSDTPGTSVARGSPGASVAQAPGARRLTLISAIPRPEAAPDSSLSTMAGFIAREPELTGTTWAFHPERGLDVGAVVRAVRASTEPVLLLTTAFALVHLLDGLEDARLALPNGSRIMETGGFKGRATEVDRATLYQRVGESLGVPSSHIVNEYGMTEMLSQAYDGVAGRAPPALGARAPLPALGEDPCARSGGPVSPAPRRARAACALRPRQRRLGLSPPDGGLRLDDPRRGCSASGAGARREPSRLFPNGGGVSARDAGAATVKEGLVMDGWVWPDGVPAPGQLEETPAGELLVRHPLAAPELTRILVTSLRDAGRVLVAIPVAELVELLGGAGEALVSGMDDGAVRQVAANAGMSTAMVREIVDGMAASWNTDALERLVAAEFPDPNVLDGFAPGNARAIRAGGPGLTLHLGAGTVPGRDRHIDLEGAPRQVGGTGEARRGRRRAHDPPCAGTPAHGSTSWRGCCGPVLARRRGGVEPVGAGGVPRGRPGRHLRERRHHRIRAGPCTGLNAPDRTPPSCRPRGGRPP